MIRFITYSVLSCALSAGAVGFAFQTHEQFYPAIVSLVTSKISMLILGNFALMSTLLLGRATKSIFFGQLRDVEVEILYDNTRYAIPETCLALTIFREELTARVLSLFTSLLFFKSFHWLCQSRVEYVESDNVSRWAHARLVSLMFALLSLDILFVASCIIFWRGPSVLILFGFEYTILAVSVLSTWCHYCLHIIDMSIEGNWPAKGSYLFFLEFLTEVVRFISYVIFFTIIFSYYGMPLHIVRDLWMSYVNLKRRLVIFNKYRKLTANMNERFPEATPGELAACEHTCIICRDSMEQGKKLPCNHIFHLDCLRLWLQQQQSCPTCRTDIPTEPVPVNRHVGTTIPATPAARTGQNAQPGRVHPQGANPAAAATTPGRQLTGVQYAQGPQAQQQVSTQIPHLSSVREQPHPAESTGAAPGPSPVPPFAISADQYAPSFASAGIPVDFPQPVGSGPIHNLFCPAFAAAPCMPPPPFVAAPYSFLGAAGPSLGYTTTVTGQPQLFRVTRREGLDIHVEAHEASPILRRVPQDFITLVLERTEDSNARKVRYQLAEGGWIIEEVPTGEVDSTDASRSGLIALETPSDLGRRMSGSLPSSAASSPTSFSRPELASISSEILAAQVRIAALSKKQGQETQRIQELIRRFDEAHGAEGRSQGSERLERNQSETR